MNLTEKMREVMNRIRGKLGDKFQISEHQIVVFGSSVATGYKEIKYYYSDDSYFEFTYDEMEVNTVGRIDYFGCVEGEDRLARINKFDIDKWLDTLLEITSSEWLGNLQGPPKEEHLTAENIGLPKTGEGKAIG